eukprot:1160941-Pelagomonas_calceolata.AAC.10
MDAPLMGREAPRTNDPQPTTPIQLSFSSTSRTYKRAWPHVWLEVSGNLRKRTTFHQCNNSQAHDERRHYASAGRQPRRWTPAKAMNTRALLTE